MATIIQERSETSGILCPNSPESATRKQIFDDAQPMKVQENISLCNPDRQSVKLRYKQRPCTRRKLKTTRRKLKLKTTRRKFKTLRKKIYKFLQRILLLLHLNLPESQFMMDEPTPIHGPIPEMEKDSISRHKSSCVQYPNRGHMMLTDDYDKSTSLLLPSSTHYEEMAETETSSGYHPDKEVNIQLWPADELKQHRIRKEEMEAITRRKFKTKKRKFKILRNFFLRLKYLQDSKETKPNISFNKKLQLRSADEIKKDGISKEEMEHIINTNMYKHYRNIIYSDNIYEFHHNGIYMVHSRNKTNGQFYHCSVLLQYPQEFKYFDPSGPDHGDPCHIQPHNKRVQHERNMTCGIHSLYMIHQISHEKKFEDILQSYSEDLEKNDNYVIKFFQDKIIRSETNNYESDSHLKTSGVQNHNYCEPITRKRISGEPSDCDDDVEMVDVNHMKSFKPQDAVTENISLSKTARSVIYEKCRSIEDTATNKRSLTSLVPNESPMVPYSINSITYDFQNLSITDENREVSMSLKKK